MRFQRKVELALKEFVKACRKKFGRDLVSIVLFGSYARGNWKRWSDIDLLVVAKNLPDRWVERKKLFDSIIDSVYKKYGKIIEVVPLTQAELISNLQKLSSFFITFLLGHRILMDKGVFLREFKKFAVDVKGAGFIYCEGGKKWDIRKEALKYLRSFG